MQEGWVSTGASHGVLSPTKTKACCWEQLQPWAQQQLERQEATTPEQPPPSFMVLAGAQHQQQLCSAAEAVLSPGASPATPGGGMGLPKIQAAEIMCRCHS